MLALLSPAKSLDYDSALPTWLPTLDGYLARPHFAHDAAALIERARALTPQDIASLMGISDRLAQLNAARFAAWDAHFPADKTRAAIYAFNGDVYEGFDAASLDAQSMRWANDHIVILSGLYGALKPLDALQPYRLEMGTALDNPRGPHLYAWWGSQIAQYIQQQLNNDPHPIIINLASQEYFKAVDKKVLTSPIIECVFQDYKNGQWKIISFHAKRARGLMARHLATTRAQTLDDVRSFSAEGYTFAPAVSDATKLVFRRTL